MQLKITVSIKILYMYINTTAFSNNKHRTGNRFRNISMKVQTLSRIESYTSL